MNDFTSKNHPPLQSSFYQFVKANQTREALSELSKAEQKQSLLKERDSSDKYTPLHWAAQNQNLELIVEITKYCSQEGNTQTQ
jgi:ankyrin repeat protein